VQRPTNGGGGGSVAGPAFSKIMSFALRRYGVAPSGAKPSHLPTMW
jgi:cell division protein FtsI (penicillin-binding protein 3)